MILVNKENKIKDNYINKIKLIKTTDVDNEEVQVEESTYHAYLKLKEFLLTKGIEIGIASAYRSVEKQIDIYNHLKEELGEEYAKKTVAPPYTSEHHTGLCIDINIKVNGHFPNGNKELESQSKYYEEIHKHLSKFGFILRYPKGKEKITGFKYEPWHIRYTGVVPATIIMNNNLTLEEYLTNFSGILVLNKEKGQTSRYYVNEISKIFGLKKVGHTGTLDPFASGVLVITLGKATKISALLVNTTKEYKVEVQVGISTDTYDITGNIIDKSNIPDTLQINKALNHFNTTYMQEVPIYSAIKINGKKLYQYARNNEQITLPKREVTITNTKLLNKTKDTFTFQTTVTKGTYIRSLVHDISTYLNTPMTTKSLTRVKQGNFKITNSYTLEDVKNNNYKLLTIEDTLPYPIITLNKETAFKAKNGVQLNNSWHIKDKVIFKYNNKILGIYQNKNNKLITWKNF